MTTLRIKATADDIAMGVPRTLTHCPIAKATKRALAALGRDERCFVCPRTIRLGSIIWSRGTTLPLPSIARRFIRRFDAGKAVEPIAFDLSLPNPSEEATCG